MPGRRCIAAISGVVIAGALVGSAAAPVAAAAAAAAAKPTITAQGDVHCVGTAKYKLHLSGQSARTGPETWYRTDVVFKPSTLRCTGTTGNGAVQAQKVKVRGSFTNWGIGISDTVFVCVPLTGRAGGGSLSLQWKAKGGTIRPTQVSYSSAFYTFGFPARLQAPSPAAPLGTSSVTGSYAGTGSSKLVLLDASNTLNFIDSRNCVPIPVTMNGRAIMAIDL